MPYTDMGAPAGGPGGERRGSGRYPYNAGLPAQAPTPPRPAPSDTRRLFRLGLFQGLTICLFLAVNELFALALVRSPLLEAYKADAAFSYLLDMAFSLVGVGLPFLAGHLLLRTQRDLRAPLPFGGVRSGSRAFLLVFAGLGVCLAGSLLTNLFASWADANGIVFESYYQALEGDTIPDSAVGAVLYVLRSAVVPALVEEFAIRGVILQPLRRFGDWYAVLISALVFGLMHHNMTQVPFAVLAGVALGYCAVVTGSLWITVLIHFLNNFIAVCHSFVLEAYGQRAGLLFSNAAVYGFLAVGLLALVFYGLRTPGLHRLREGTYRRANRAIYFAAPTVILAFGILLFYTAVDVRFS